MNKEYTYDIDKYTIGVDENGEGGIGLTVAIIKNGEINFLGNCYGENARCLDLLIKENQELKQQLENKYEKVGTLTTELLYEENTKLINQQKEFIKYLENEIKIYSNTYMGEMLKELKEILQRYKSIIGGNKDEK